METSKPIILRNFIPEDLRKYLSYACKIYLRANNKEFCYTENGVSSSAHHDAWTDALSLSVLKKLKEVTQKRLEPTYSFLRIYNRYATLQEHIDRDSCEYSVTVHIDSCGTYDWPIKMNGVNYSIKPGEAILYKGIDWKHSRDEFLGDWHAQCFLHYVDIDGPRKDFVYDKRKVLGVPYKHVFDVGTQGLK